MFRLFTGSMRLNVRPVIPLLASVTVCLAHVLFTRHSSKTLIVQAYATQLGLPLSSVPHAFVTLSGDLNKDLATGAYLMLVLRTLNVY